MAFQILIISFYPSPVIVVTLNVVTIFEGSPVYLNDIGQLLKVF